MCPSVHSLHRPALLLAALLLATFAASGITGQTQTEPADGYVSVPGCRLVFLDNVALASERAGIVEEVVREGASVSRDAVVARLRDSVLRAGVAIAELEASNDLEIRFARKASQLARLNYERAAGANRTWEGTVPDLELSELQLAAEKAALQLEQAEHQHAVAALRRDEMRHTLATLQVTAPFDAFVRSVFKKPGEFVREGETIAEIVNLDRIRVEGYISAHDLPRVQTGNRVEVRLTGPGMDAASSKLRFFGQVGFVDVKVEPVSQKIRVWADVLNTDGVLREGLTATLFIETGESGTPSDLVP